MTVPAELHLYEYAVVRYVPAVEREEFINVGLLMMCKRRRWLRIRFHVDERKLGVYRCGHTAQEIRRQLQGFVDVCEGAPAGGTMARQPVEERFRWLTAAKSASLATSRPHPGKTDKLNEEFNRLFEELVM